MIARYLGLGILVFVAACEPKGAGTANPDGTGAVLPAKESGERAEKIRAALRYRRAAEQRGFLVWQEASGAAAVERMYLQGADDLGELTFVHAGGGKANASITILARGKGMTGKCVVTLNAGDTPIKINSKVTRLAPPPKDLRVEVDRLDFALSSADLLSLAKSPDSAGSACGMAFSFTRAQRDRLERASALFSAGGSQSEVTAAQTRWEEDRLPATDGGFRELGEQLGTKSDAEGSPAE